jgi:Holliday junction resolvase
MGNASRRKGANGERELVNLLSDALGTVVTRNLSQTRDGGRDILGIPGYAIEVKRCETTRWGAWLEQAQRQAAEGETPVVAHRANGEPWLFLVAMDKDQFCKYVRENL